MAKAYDDWFTQLRNMRREITHRAGGFFHLDKENKVVYFQGSMTRKPEIIDDVVSLINTLEAKVRSFIETLAHYFLQQLAPKPRMYPCGTYDARLYIRMVAPEPN